MAPAPRPRDGPFTRLAEQRYAVWRPAPSLGCAVALLLGLAAAAAALGVPLLVANLTRAVTVRVRYDSAGPSLAGLSRHEQQRALWAADSDPSGPRPLTSAQLLLLPRPLAPPAYLLYELGGFSGTHKRYVRSVDWQQVAGRQQGPGAGDRCAPAQYLGGAPNASLPAAGLINPCGLRATSLFNDSFALEADAASCGLQQGGQGGRRQGAAGAGAQGAGGGWVLLQLDTGALHWEQGARHLYGPPYNATNFNPQAPGPWAGSVRSGGAAQRPVGQDPRLEVWMRPPASPDSLKLYALLHAHLPAGCRLRLTVQHRYSAPYGWGGTKRVLLAGQSWAGLRNLVLPVALLAAAGGGLGGAAVLLAMAAVLRRRGG